MSSGVLFPGTIRCCGISKHTRNVLVFVFQFVFHTAVVVLVLITIVVVIVAAKLAVSLGHNDERTATRLAIALHESDHAIAGV